MREISFSVCKVGMCNLGTTDENQLKTLINRGKGEGKN